MYTKQQLQKVLEESQTAFETAKEKTEIIKDEINRLNQEYMTMALLAQQTSGAVAMLTRLMSEEEDTIVIAG